MVPLRKPLKTYTHLARERRMPSEYELLSSKLLYGDPSRKLEVSVPLERFTRTHRARALAMCSDWERFDDPRKTTYARYVEQQQKQECYVSGLTDAMDAPVYTERLAPTHLERMRYLVALRFPLHALQMVASYLGHLAPSGKVVIAFALQAADEMRRVQRIAYRMAQLREVHPAFGDDARALWQEDPKLQPLRKLVERLLVTYDFVEAFVALNVVTKPLVDALVLTELADTCEASRDPMMAEVLRALAQDAAWHRTCTHVLVQVLLDSAPENRELLGLLATPFEAPAREAATSLAEVLLGVSADEAARIVARHTRAPLLTAKDAS
jgi:toluene monooxygenase system protein E